MKYDDCLKYKIMEGKWKKKLADSRTQIKVSTHHRNLPIHRL